MRPPFQWESNYVHLASTCSWKWGILATRWYLFRAREVGTRLAHSHLCLRPKMERNGFCNLLWHRELEAIAQFDGSRDSQLL